MSCPCRVLPVLVAAAALGSGGAPASALPLAAGAARAPSGTGGGAQAPAAPAAGGAEYGVLTLASASQRPVVASLRVPRVAPPGAPPRVLLRVDEPGVPTVEVEVVVRDLIRRRTAIRARLGWVRTGRTVSVRWPRGARLTAGSYSLSVGARDPHGATLRRSARASGVAALTIAAPIAPPAPAPPTPAPSGEAGAPSPAQTAAAGAVFPVAGPHSYGDAENRFGAPRSGHIHQGQDVLTAEGTPVLAPLAGTIASASNQAGGAGYYLVEHTAIGLDFMFAHCEAGSFAVSAGQAVAAGQQLCSAGQTGDATGPHLHFEIWVGGWQSPTGHPIDPLPYLQAWERPAS
jgi:biotin carboxyl carrier protein